MRFLINDILPHFVKKDNFKIKKGFVLENLVNFKISLQNHLLITTVFVIYNHKSSYLKLH